MRILALPKEVEHWSLTTLREKLVKTGAKVVSHGRYVTFQLAEVAVPRDLFLAILRLMSKSLLPVFSSRSFMLSDLTLESLIHFELTFVYNVR